MNTPQAFTVALPSLTQARPRTHQTKSRTAIFRDMFATLQEVSFWSHWLESVNLRLEFFLIVATIGSMAASAVLGYLAFHNGRAATRIAEQASTREQQHREAESARLVRESRAALALAMIRAINAVDTTSSKHIEINGVQNPHRVAARQQEDVCVDEALALITVSNADADSIKFRNWFLHMIRHMRGLSSLSGKPSEANYQNARNNLLAHIAKWNSDPTFLPKMLKLDFTGKLGRDKALGDCTRTQGE